MEQSGESALYFVTGEIISIEQYVPGTGFVTLDNKAAAAILDQIDFTCIDLHRDCIGPEGPLWECYDRDGGHFLVDGATWSPEQDEHLPLFIAALEQIKTAKGIKILVT